MKMFKKQFISLMLVLILALTMLPFSALAADEPAAYEIKTSACTLIGTNDSDENLYYIDIPKGTADVCFPELSLKSADSMIAQISGNYYVSAAETVQINNFPLTYSDIADDESWEFNDSFASCAEDDLYGFWIMDDSLDMYYFIVHMAKNEETAPPTFTVKVNGKEITDITYKENVFTTTDIYTNEITGTCGAYMVKLPEICSTAELSFSQNVLAYNYRGDGLGQYGPFLEGFYADYMTGSSSRIVKIDSNKDGIADFIQVQSPYDSSYQSSVHYIIGFETDALEYPGGVKTAELEKAMVPSKTESKFSALYNALSEKCLLASDWFALCGSAMNPDAAADTEKIISDALAAAENPSGTNLQSSIIILSALGVPVTDIEGVNLIDILANNENAVGGWAESPAYTLLAYAASPDIGIPESAPNSPSKMISLLKETYQNEDGGFGWGGTSCPDTIGAVLAALSNYAAVNKDAHEMCEAALQLLYSMENEDGGWGYAKGAATNPDSTALAVIGICALGNDPSYGFKKANPISALLSFANQDLTGLDLPSGSNITYTESDVMRALCAYSGFRNTSGAYNIYTDALKHSAGYLEAEISYDDLFSDMSGCSAGVKNNIIKTYQAGWINGFPDGTFRPSDPCTREQIMIILWRSQGCPLAKSDEVLRFVKDWDKIKSASGNAAFAWAIERGLIKGFSDGSLQPQSSCTREQFTIILWRLYGMPTAESAAGRFSDISVLGATSQNAISWAYQQGIINGYSDGTFGPKKICERQHVVTMLFRATRD